MTSTDDRVQDNRGNEGIFLHYIRILKLSSKKEVKKYLVLTFRSHLKYL